ncbi:aminoacyl-tRNA hydrolase [Candidatus Peribacteria bacterium RIFOXYC2_FULL_55_14]|nr:MAG: Peptidyl-tRNA hydrolase [Candidatus Peribacteria bacterium GW2011_GWC2_54_8]KKW40042.1 MAG: Peptidyl-tRNA hydrolase [Candidatus Peregrinibacteria bacterium GW2011_GWA2_54_9]OGJ72026.1 MAG: aminoacyl-tRNA hydrolase [Candidatus Peribacteria bacterium RIFOXYA1_FULL_56_14]OGJ74037.1 MAG: aminoacyl-tRNA hydrolase [Candidatus Peribacteria bacterium RIFOXYA2_FULL_55_28]OGJ75468.1 MAG: aminoacyl-tRNA hydrolase [Candidatus Peribacteria bacterium RIFOXYB1_FULL_54_35]OGJ76356.1 MAG: aminoacyl-tRN
MTCVKRVHYGCVKPTLVIIGLGNPGRQYEHTRHNVGFQAVDALSEAFGEGEWQEKQKYLSFVQEARIVTVPALLVKPQTYMNLSGNAVEKLMKFFELDSSSQMLVLCDDVDLPLGEVRLRGKGGPGTHNGLKSLDEKFGEHYARLRIGLGAQPPETDLATWVLSVPTEEEKKALQEAIKRIPELVKEYVVGEGADMSGSI